MSQARSREFHAEGEHRYDRTSPARWVLSHTLRYPLFVAEKGRYFLPLYDFELSTGAWRHRQFAPPEPAFGLEEARRLAGELEPAFRRAALDTTERDLIPFAYCRR